MLLLSNKFQVMRIHPGTDILPTVDGPIVTKAIDLLPSKIRALDLKPAIKDITKSIPPIRPKITSVKNLQPETTLIKNLKPKLADIDEG